MVDFRNWIAGILCVIAVFFIAAAFQEETFRAWNFGQAAVVSAVLALVVKQ